MQEKEASSCEKQCKWRNSVGKLQEERGSSTRDDTSDGDDSRASSARGTIIGEQHSDALSRTICRIPSDPELLPPGAQCDLATSKVICFLDDNYAVIPTGVTGSSWKRQDFLIIGKDRNSVLGLVIYPSVISADRNDELTVLAKPHQPPLIIPPNTSIARAFALPPHAAEQVLPVLREQDPPSGMGGNTLCLQSEDAIVVSGPGEPTPPIIRHFSNSTRAKLKENPLVLVRNPETGQIEGPFKLITWGKGYACVSTAVGPKWLVARHVKPYRVQTQAETDPKTGGREVGTQTKQPYHVMHVRSHTDLPGAIVDGNKRADTLAMVAQTPALSDTFQQAKLSHQFYHQIVPALVRMFHLTREQAKAVEFKKFAHLVWRTTSKKSGILGSSIRKTTVTVCGQPPDSYQNSRGMSGVDGKPPKFLGLQGYRISQKKAQMVKQTVIYLGYERFLKYQAIMVEQDDVEIVVTNTVNPASFLSGSMGEPVIHECLEAIEATCSSCLDLKDTLLENTETWSTDGSSCVISGRHAGYVVTMSREVIESGPLPTNTSAQKAEITA
ncbi:hypothetical protein DUI87_33726 [Hirundo rustica rustica]|uniref:Uncharacterized protein n=1 Tax=Hirundo rustica rustica TaxID=333673 RepID=A0A3M0INB1_HIRRU|nr:hypothetical protein DUI87_33726 [Hirundo rustica rustica]